MCTRDPSQPKNIQPEYLVFSFFLLLFCLWLVFVEFEISGTDQTSILMTLGILFLTMIVVAIGLYSIDDTAAQVFYIFSCLLTVFIIATVILWDFAEALLVTAFIIVLFWLWLYFIVNLWLHKNYLNLKHCTYSFCPKQYRVKKIAVYATEDTQTQVLKQYTNFKSYVFDEKKESKNNKNNMTLEDVASNPIKLKKLIDHATGKFATQHGIFLFYYFQFAYFLVKSNYLRMILTKQGKYNKKIQLKLEKSKEDLKLFQHIPKVNVFDSNYFRLTYLGFIPKIWLKQMLG